MECVTNAQARRLATRAEHGGYHVETYNQRELLGENRS